VARVIDFAFDLLRPASFTSAHSRIAVDVKSSPAFEPTNMASGSGGSGGQCTG